jgi:hypothetical protein
MKKKMLIAMLAPVLLLMWLGAGFAQGIPDNLALQEKYMKQLRQVNASPQLSEAQKRMARFKLKRQMLLQQALRQRQLDAQKAAPEGSAVP